MSLDATHDAMIAFQKQLQHFNENVRISYKELQNRQFALDPLWQDEARAAYDRAMHDLDAEIADYLRRDSERFEQFIREKVWHLQNYLYG